MMLPVTINSCLKYINTSFSINVGTGTWCIEQLNDLYPKTSAGNTRPIAASNSFVAQTRRYPRLWRGTSKRWLFYVGMSLWYVVRLTTHLDLESRNILKSDFDFKSNLTSVIGNWANHSFLASYVSRHKVMDYDTCPHKWSCQRW